MPKIGIVASSSPPLRAFGITCGIGSMLLGAQQAGFQVVGNVEWRKYYHYQDSEGRNTFTENFPGAFLRFSLKKLTREELESVRGVNLAMGHPECGAYSQLSSSNKNREEMRKSQSDIPLMWDIAAKIQPVFLVMDDLALSLVPFPMSEYARRLPDYDFFPELVSNWGYGNVQKQRNRFFMIAARKDQKFVFKPGEFQHDTSVKDVIGDLLGAEGQVANHDHHDQFSLCAKGLHLKYRGHRATWAELADYVNSVRPGQTIPYIKPDGSVGTRIGTYKGHWDGPGHVMTGGLSALHPLRGDPFSVRERARIQGFPDNFVFYGTVLEEDGSWNHDRNIHMVKQTGKAMPIQFNRYAAQQIAAHVSKQPFQSTGVRLQKPNPHVDQAKLWFCANVGYSDQEGACQACWLKKTCELRANKTRAGDVRKVFTLFSVGVPLAVKDTTTITKLPARPVSRQDSVSVKLSSSSRKNTQEHALEVVKLIRGVAPSDYHCGCRFCRVVIGELRRGDGSYYSRNDRRLYYSQEERASTKNGSGHIAKTPLHLARWAVQQYTKPGDWVLDPTAGAGTTLVEALTHGRNAVGVEIQTVNVIQANIAHAAQYAQTEVPEAVVRVIKGDARNLRSLLSSIKEKPQFSLVVNNPPYSGDESQKGCGQRGYEYDRSQDNLAFLGEGEEYYHFMQLIWAECVRHLKIGGWFVIGVKDQMRNRQPDGLHHKLCETVEKIPGIAFEGTAFLKHYPATLHLNTYGKRYGIEPPLYQTINVFRKEN